MTDLDVMFSEVTNATMRYINAIDELINCLEEEKATVNALWELVAKRQRAIKADDQKNANG